MSFALNAGYIPASIETLMGVVRENVNTQFNTAYTVDSFQGTNFYKYFYALIQRLQENEVKTAEIFQQLQEYFETTNDRILRPNTTAPGIIDFFDSKDYLVSVKPPADEDAGKVFICVDVDDAAPDYAARKLAICQYIRDCVVAGVISQGTEEEELTLSNAQAFTFKFNLPNKIPVLLKASITLSENNQAVIESPEVVRQRIFDNITAKYHLGMNFEPQRYFSVVDAPWASNVLLEWSDDDGMSYDDGVFDADYDDVYTFEIGDIEIVEV